jgi:hypothetical protein
MKIVKEGDKGRAVCETCGLVTTTYHLRDVPFNDKSGVVKNILAGVCDKCEKVVSIPRQSTPMIKAKFMETRKSSEFRVPAHFIDILRLASIKIDENVGEELSKALILYYVHNLDTGRFSSSELKGLLLSELASAPSTKRLSIKITNRTEEQLVSVVNRTGLKSNTDVIKGIILKIYEDILMPKTPKHFNELRSIASVFG